MILKAEKTRTPALIDLTPLINIIFLILIFFMLAGTIKPGDLLETARIEAGAAIESNLLVVAIPTDGIVLINGEPLSDEELSAVLIQHRVSDGAVGVKPDARLEAARLVEISEVVQKSGFAELTLITRNP